MPFHEPLRVAAAESDAIAWTKNPAGDAAQWQIVRPYDVTAEGDNANAICPDPNDPTKIIECPKAAPIYRKVRSRRC